MRLSLRTSALIASGLILVMSMVTAGSGLVSIQWLSHALTESQRSSQLVTVHMGADMMHDAIRGDVTTALLAAARANPDGVKVAAQDLKDHVAEFNQAIEAERALARTLKEIQTLDALKAPLAAYAASASEVIALAATSPDEAARKFHYFYEKFEDLEGSMSEATEVFEAQHASDNAAAAAKSTFGVVAIIAAFAVAALIGALIAANANKVARALVRLGAAATKLGAGELDGKILDQRRTDEVGALAQSLASLQTELRKGAELKAEKQAAAEALSQVVAALADGMTRLSSGDFSRTIDQSFAAEFETLRRDFNGAVAKLADGEAEKARVAKAQTNVVDGLAEGLRRLSQGDLTTRLEQPFTAEYERLREDFNAAVATLKDTLLLIASSAEGIVSGSGQINSAADELSTRTENQAATLEQTAAALDESTAAVRQTAANASETSKVISSARADADKTGELVRSAVSAMGEIEKSSNQISQIIGVIDDIAFQTNLLALNAGVEAARAGDAGKGFAVVAQEVRALAQRSSVAAKEIKQLISSSGEQVEGGVKLVKQTGEALSVILERFEHVAHLVSDIAISAKEQSTSLGEVNSAMNRIDQTTQQNAAMVEETTTATRNLTGEAERLMSKIATFNTGAERRHQSAAPRPSYGLAQIQNEKSKKSVAAQRQKAHAYAASIDGANALKRDEEWETF